MYVSAFEMVFNTTPAVFDPPEKVSQCIRRIILWYGGNAEHRECCNPEDGRKTQMKEGKDVANLEPFFFETCRSRLTFYVKIELYHNAIASKWTNPQRTNFDSIHFIPRCYDEIPLAEDPKLSDKVGIMILAGLAVGWVLAILGICCCCFKKKKTGKTVDSSDSSELSEVISQRSWSSRSRSPSKSSSEVIPQGSWRTRSRSPTESFSSSEVVSQGSWRTRSRSPTESFSSSNST